ncbi:MAG: DNA/RNA nuclease SfsA [Treponema sp.]|nr:DNA/RNA nuclease SfsA [Treponema sp.]
MDKVKRPVRFFNITGPCNPWDHYMLPPEERLVGAQLHRYIRDYLYWVLHAPRQTGKTTFLQNWMREINSGRFNGGNALACYVSVESCQGISEPERSMPALCTAIREYASSSNIPAPKIEAVSPMMMLSVTLGNWAKLVAPQPLVVLFDEADVLEGETLISFLRQLRGGFAARGPGIFPVSIALVGMRDLKDYITAAKGSAAPNPGSPFNIKEDSVVLSNFQREDIVKLFAQRTEETGQAISEEALDYVYEQSRGQPWIVNALFQRAVMRILDEDSRETVSIDHVMRAREDMILARETHLDALAVRMEDTRVRRVMETLISGESDPTLSGSEGFRLCMDLGLVSKEGGTPQVANPIYREVLARYMTMPVQDAIPSPEWEWRKADGSLNMDALLKEFQQFWRENSEIWEEKSDYTEAFPHLLLMAFLQRVLNGGGKVDREYAAGRGRMDLYVEYNGGKYIIEIKLVHERQNPEQVTARGLEQIEKYRDGKAPDASAYLVVFDRRLKAKEASWEERLSWTQAGTVTVVRG